MSPMNERELREELHRAAPHLPDSDHLSRAVQARGHAIRRRRILVATAVIALVGASGVTLWATAPRAPQHATPLQTPPAPSTPSATPSLTPSSVQPTPAASSAAPTSPSLAPSGTPSVRPSATPSGSATRTWSSRVRVPGSFGDLGAFTLQADASPGKAKPGWRAENSPAVLCNIGPEPAMGALGRVVAGRTLTSSEGESVSRQGVLRFDNDASAAMFLTEVRAIVSRCDAAQPTTGKAGASREVAETTQPSGLGHEALTTGSHQQLWVDGAWRDAPGGDATLWVRQGRTVTFAFEGGEFVGPVWSGRPDITTRLRGTVQHALQQL